MLQGCFISAVDSLPGWEYVLCAQCITPKLIQKSNLATLTVFILFNILFGILAFIAYVHIPVGTLDAMQILSVIVASCIFALLRTHYTKEEYPMITIIIDVTTGILIFIGVIFLVQVSELFTPHSSTKTPLDIAVCVTATDLQMPLHQMIQSVTILPQKCTSQPGG